MRTKLSIEIYLSNIGENFQEFKYRICDFIQTYHRLTKHKFMVKVYENNTHELLALKDHPPATTVLVNQHMHIGKLFLQPNDYSPTAQFIRSCIQYIAQYVNAPYNAHQLASCMNVSQSTLYRKLRQYTGMNSQRFIQYIRMHIAYILLQEKKFTITDIAYHCGFSSTRNFINAFKKVFHQHPQHVRGE